MCCRKCVFGKHGVAATGDSTCGVGLGLGAAFRFRVLAVALVVRFLGAAFPLVAFTLGVACLAAVLVFLAALVAGFAFGAALRLAVAFCFTAARFFAVAGFLGLDKGASHLSEDLIFPDSQRVQAAGHGKVKTYQNPYVLKR